MVCAKLHVALAAQACVALWLVRDPLQVDGSPERVLPVTLAFPYNATNQREGKMGPVLRNTMSTSGKHAFSRRRR